MRACGFCGDPDVTQEHVWADWLRKVILDSRSEGGMKTFRAEIERGAKTTSFPKSDLEITVGMPCARCNNGWMSGLENDVMSFMTDMVYRGMKTLLDADRQRALIRWIVKTAMVYEFTGAAVEQKYFTADERKAFKESYALPANMWIWLGRYDGVLPVHSLQLRATSEDVRPRVYSLTFTANFLAMQVFAFRESESDLAQYARATTSTRLMQLYPQPGGWMNWPPPTTIDDEGLQVLDYRFQTALSRR
jgi:hypothetical protein